MSIVRTFAIWAVPLFVFTLEAWSAPIKATRLYAGGIHNCALLEDGSVKCWGANRDGQLGLGDTANRGRNRRTTGDSLEALKFAPGESVFSMALGYSHTCALLKDQTVKCWGKNRSGQLGYGDRTTRGNYSSNTPDRIGKIDFGRNIFVRQIAAGLEHTCAILTDGRLKCWGSNSRGQLGVDASGSIRFPDVKLGMGRTVQQVVLGKSHTCALLDNHQVKCWGGNEKGQLGQGHSRSIGINGTGMGDVLPPINLGHTEKVIRLSGGLNFTCAHFEDFTAKCWGDNVVGQLGLGDTLHRGLVPDSMSRQLPFVKLSSGDQILDLFAGPYHSCALLLDQTLKCWGFGENGALGYEDKVTRGKTPQTMGESIQAVQLGTGLTVDQVAIGDEHTCALFFNGRIKCWGYNYDGELGLGDVEFRGDNPGEMGDSLPFVNLGTI